MPNPDPIDPFAPLAGLGGMLLLPYILFVVALGALTLRIMYAVIWRAVRRGLREFHYPGGKTNALSAQSAPGRIGNW